MFLESVTCQCNEMTAFGTLLIVSERFFTGSDDVKMNANISWSHESDEILIDFVKQHDALYNI